MAEMATFQDLVSDEHKEKKKGFRNIAGNLAAHAGMRVWGRVGALREVLRCFISAPCRGSDGLSCAFKSKRFPLLRQMGRQEPHWWTPLGKAKGELTLTDFPSAVLALPAAPAGMCKRHLEGQAKRRDQRHEEVERLRRQQAKVLSGAVSAFWVKVEHVQFPRAGSEKKGTHAAARAEAAVVAEDDDFDAAGEQVERQEAEDLALDAEMEAETSSEGDEEGQGGRRDEAGDLAKEAEEPLEELLQYVDPPFLRLTRRELLFLSFCAHSPRCAASFRLEYAWWDVPFLFFCPCGSNTGVFFRPSMILAGAETDPQAAMRDAPKPRDLEDEEEATEDQERLEALIAERDEEDAKLDEEMDSCEDDQSETGAVDDLLNEAEAPLSEVLKSYGYSSVQEFLSRRAEDASRSSESDPEDLQRAEGANKGNLAADSESKQFQDASQQQKRERPGEGVAEQSLPKRLRYPRLKREMSTTLSPEMPEETQHEMGLGKTIQTIALLAKLALEMGVWGPHLVVVPTSVLENWETEFKKFLPGFRVVLYYGSAAERQKKRQGWTRKHAFNVCIVSYATAVKDAAILKRREWYSMVLDEAQNIKNFSSKRWQTLLTFNSQHRLLLTGTPLQNHLLELWSLMHFLMPTLFSSHENFKEWFDSPLTAAIEQSRVQRHQRLVAKLHQVLRPYILRRLKKDVEKQMPSKYEHVIKCELTRRQRCLYDEFLGSRAVQGTLDQQQYRGMMNALMQLRKVCNHPDLFEARPTRTPVGADGLGILEATIPASVCLWLQEPWCLTPEAAIKRLTGPLTSLLLREAHGSKWAELAADELASPIQCLLSSPPPPFPKCSAGAREPRAVCTEGRLRDASLEAYLAAFDLPVLVDPFTFSVRDIPPPTFSPALPSTAASNPSPPLQTAGPSSWLSQQHLAQLEGGAARLHTAQEAECRDAAGSPTAQPCLEGGEHEVQQPVALLSTAASGETAGSVAWRVPEQGLGDQQAQAVRSSKSLIDGSWFLGVAFGAASIPDVGGVMRAKQREMEEAQQPLDDVLPLPLKFLHYQVSLELNGDEDLPPQNASEGAPAGSDGWRVTAAEAAFDGLGSAHGWGGVPASSSRAVRSRWQYLLQRSHERLTGLPVVPRRLPENDTASAAARAARQRPWCQRQLREAAAAREDGQSRRFRFLCYLHFLHRLAPSPHLGSDGRRYLRRLVRQGATYPPFYVYDQASLRLSHSGTFGFCTRQGQAVLSSSEGRGSSVDWPPCRSARLRGGGIRSSDDFFRQTSYSSSLFPTPSQVCEHLRPLLSLFTLRGQGGPTARFSSLSALEGAALTLLEGYRLREPVLRREHPPTYGLRWGSPQGAGEASGSAASDFRVAYATQLQKGAADDDRGIVLGRHIMHVPACYCVAGTRPALCPENDYYNDLLTGASRPQCIVVSQHAETNSAVRETLARMECLFPPKQLIQDDCGKLIAMAELLHKLRAGGHRCIIFTQFSRMLDVLESWINYQGFVYLRLDGSTKVENRQRIVNQFNTNPRIFLFIASTRAGGVGINLTGADTVIFYDTDWNPAMDRQAMDRCHRIGQTRDVHIYRLVCAHTIEENIWRKQLQKRLLDEIVVDQGSFTITNAAKKLGRLEVDDQKGSDLHGAEWFSNANTLKELLTIKQEQTEDLYVDRVLHESTADTGNAPLAPTRDRNSAFESAMDELEDVEDRAALRQTAKEQKTVQQEMSDDFRDENPDAVDDVSSALNELPALATYCVKFLSDNKSDALIAQIERFKAQLEGEGAEVGEGEPGAATESASAADGSEDNSGSEMSAAWESELEEQDGGESAESK
ncbi:snf2 family N-terminal domain-containing protein [Cyclospora cayetanensis]|uniref:Snf2 family N-terminal domain-containing protein n=1 Tax=Cyclospora cayetanensis TaxID=88456 RepID=A0A1D3D1M4_9EIME|nr:snf2 family N-terminal domain-containing protein [Cyclospora cayetanensis]